MAKKKKLEILLKEMDDYDWGSVPDWKPSKIHIKSCKERFQEHLDKTRLELSGIVLDVCCGPVSYGVIHDNVVGYDLLPAYIKELRKNGINGVIGDIPEMPFKDKTFDYVICSGPPTTPYKKVDEDFYLKFCSKVGMDPKKSPESYCFIPTGVGDLGRFIDSLIDDCLRVAKKKTLIVSLPIVNMLPERNRLKIEKLSKKRQDSYVLYSHSHSVYVKNLWKKIKKR